MESNTTFEPLLASSKRVIRNQTVLSDVIAAYPSLKQKCLSSPSTLTDSERRLLLDLPDVDMETANISAVTSLLRGELIEKAISDRTGLTKEEIVLLKDRFWTPSPREERSTIFNGLCQTTEETREQFEAARQPAYLLNEQEAFGIGITEFWKRTQNVKNNAMHIKARAALPYTTEWIQHLYREEKANWGFICLYDAAAQKLDPQRLDDFGAHLGGFFSQALQYNGSKDIIDHKWQLIPFNAPDTVFAPAATPDSDDVGDSITNYRDGALLRMAFREILKDPQEYEAAENVIAMNTYPLRFKDNIAALGLLTNTFLVIDPVCIDSVLASGRWYDNMRILAFEADFPVEGRKYIEGYSGYTWVRLDQLVYYFYELRLIKANEVGMDEIWKAAQASRNKAFVSINPEEAISWTTSRPMSGFTHDSILGKRWNFMRDARRESEENQ